MIARIFGQNVYRLRMEKGLTQECFSARAGISRTHLQMIESAKTVASIEVVEKIKKLLRCSWDDLLD